MQPVRVAGALACGGLLDRDLAGRGTVGCETVPGRGLTVERLAQVPVDLRRSRRDLGVRYGRAGGGDSSGITRHGGVIVDGLVEVSGCWLCSVCCLGWFAQIVVWFVALLGPGAHEVFRPQRDDRYPVVLFTVGELVFQLGEFVRYPQLHYGGAVAVGDPVGAVREVHLGGVLLREHRPFPHNLLGRFGAGAVVQLEVLALPERGLHDARFCSPAAAGSVSSRSSWSPFCSTDPPVSASDDGVEPACSV